MKILVADDSKVARVYVIKAVKSIGIEADFLEASNGAEAVELYKDNKIDAVFLDLTMPIMDGYEALDRIVKFDKNAQVIVISADVQSEAKLRVLRSGAKNMYSKPINEEVMREIFSKDLLIL